MENTRTLPHAPQQTHKHTNTQLGMEDMDTLDVFLHQVGGGGGRRV
jgi:hypothetical protein